MVLVNMVIAERVNKLANFKPTHMRDQMHQQGVRADIEGHAKERVGGTLIELAVQYPRIHFELKQGVAGRQVYVISLARIPTRHDQAPRVGVILDSVDESSNLIDAVTRRIVTTKRSPEVTVNRPQIARLALEAFRVLFIGPLGPDVDAARAQVRFVRVAGEKPK